MTHGRSRQERHQEAKQAILQAARTLILEKGPERLSLREVARRSEYSPANLYEYFDSKDDLIAAVAAESLARLSTYLRRVATELPPPLRVVEIGLAYVRFARENPHHFRLIFIQLTSQRTAPDEPVRAGSPYEIVRQVVQDGVEQGVFMARTDYGIEEMAYGIWVIVHGMAMLQLTHLQHFQADFPSMDRQVLDVFVEGLRHT